MIVRQKPKPRVAPSAAKRARQRLPVALLAVVLLAAALPRAVSAATAHNAYVTNLGSGNVSAYSIAADGGLAAVSGSPFAAGGFPVRVAMTPDGAHLYVTNETSFAVSAYSIAADGSLSAVGGSPFATGDHPAGVAVTPDGTHLYIANLTVSSTPGTVSAYSIAADGSLTAVSGSPFSAGSHPAAVAVTPDGAHLYVANNGSSNVSAYSIAGDGTLSAVPGSPFAAGSAPGGVVVTPDGAHLFLVNGGSGTVSAYSIAANGSLTAVPGSPFGTGTNAFWVAVTPDGKQLYVTDFGSPGAVFAYSIAADGSLSAVGGSPFPAGNMSDGVAVTPDSTHLYVASRDVGGPGTVFAYSIAPDGSLIQLSGSPFAAETAPSGVAVRPDQGPVAAFSAAPAAAGSAASFDASASSDSDGTVVRYQWDFGDGTMRTTSSPTTAHTYGTPGTYSAALTVTDDGTCSTTHTYTGQTMSCNGGPAAKVSHQVSVATASPSLVTNASAAIALGGTVNDTVTLAGGSSPTGQITYALYGPDDSSCSGTPAFTDTKAVSGNGDYQSSDFPPTAPGTYRWIASYSGDSNNNAASGACNDAGESVTVTAQPLLPAVTKLHLVPDSFTTASKPTPLGPPTPKRANGTEIRFSTNTTALVHFSIRHAPRRPNPHGPKVPHAFNRRLGAGKHSVPFTGTLDHHTLRPGNYKLFVRAIDEASGFRSPKVSAAFTVLAG